MMSFCHLLPPSCRKGPHLLKMVSLSLCLLPACLAGLITALLSSISLVISVVLIALIYICHWHSGANVDQVWIKLFVLAVRADINQYRNNVTFLLTLFGPLQVTSNAFSTWNFYTTLHIRDICGCWEEKALLSSMQFNMNIVYFFH